MMTNALEMPIPMLNIPLWQALLIGAAVFIVYLLITQKPKMKEFKALDLKKETKNRYKKQYKFFGIPIGKNVYDASVDSYKEKDPRAKPYFFAIGYMKVVENKHMKKLEPIHPSIPKDVVDARKEKTAKEIYEKAFSELDDTQKKNVIEVVKEESRYEEAQNIPQDQNTRIVRGKIESKYTVPIPMYLMKVCGTDFTSKMLARFIGYGIDWMVFNHDQLNFEVDRILLTGDFQSREFNNIFVFSKEGKNMVQDVGFGVEREEFMGATANSIQRVLFNNDNAREINIRREEAKIEKDKWKTTSESSSFG